MKIGMIAPLFESCPPMLYGGTERIVANLCDGLVDLGHDVTLFASGDSNTRAKLVNIVPTALRDPKKAYGNVGPYIALQVSKVVDQAKEFDIIHNHIDYHPFPFIASSPTTTNWVTTPHGRLDLPESKIIYEYFDHLKLVSISLNQRTPLPDNNWVNNVYHGIKLDAFRPNYNSGNYLAFLGRICPDKGIEVAINVSKKVGVPLKIAAKVDFFDKEYYEEIIKKQIDGRQIEYIGEITESEKSEFLGNAMALLAPINWPEPFGLVVIESYACGTPVIARPLGSFPEIIKHNETGFLYYSTEQLADGVIRSSTLNRRAIRQYADRNFSHIRMAKQYESTYYDVRRNTASSGALIE